MHAVLDPKDLSKVMKTVTSLFPNLPDLACLFVASKKSLTVTAATTGIFATARIPASVSAEGSAIISAEHVCSLKMPGKMAEMVASEKGISVKAGRFRAQLNALTKGPKVEQESKMPVFPLGMDIFAAGVDALTYNSNLMGDKGLKYIRIVAKGKEIQFMTNDSYTMGHYKTEIPKGKDFEFVVPEDVLSKIMPSIESDFEFGCDGGAIRLKAKNFEVIHPYIPFDTAKRECKIHNAETRIKNMRAEKPAAAISFKTQEAKTALEAVATFLLKQDEAVNVIIAPDRCSFDTMVTHGKAKNSFKPESMKGKEFKTKLSGFLLLEFLKRCGQTTNIAFYPEKLIIDSGKATYIMTTIL